MNTAEKKLYPTHTHANKKTDGPRLLSHDGNSDLIYQQGWCHRRLGRKQGHSSEPVSNEVTLSFHGDSRDHR